MACRKTPRSPNGASTATVRTAKKPRRWGLLLVPLGLLLGTEEDWPSAFEALNERQIEEGVASLRERRAPTQIIYNLLEQVLDDPSVDGVALAARLAELTPTGLNRVFFVGSGSEANETARKIADDQILRAHGGLGPAVHGGVARSLTQSARRHAIDPGDVAVPVREVRRIRESEFGLMNGAGG